MLTNLFLKTDLKYLLTFFNLHQNMSIFDLYRSFKTANANMSRQFCTIVQNEAFNIYGSKCIKPVIAALERGDCIFAANHGGFENLPYVLSSSIAIKALSSMLNIGDNIIFTCNSITPKNPSVPGGIILAKRNFNQKTFINLLPRKYDQCFLDNVRPLEPFDVIRNADKINRLCLTYEKEAFNNLQHQIFASSSFIKQSAILNTKLYNNFMPSAHAQNYYIPIEAVAKRSLLLDLKNDHSFINKLIDNPDRLLLLLQDLAGKRSCFAKDLIDLNNELDSLDNIYGTILFYAINSKHEKEQCKIIKKTDGLYLKSYNMELKLDRDHIYEALHQDLIVPSIFTINTTFMLDHGVSLVGGIFMGLYMINMLQACHKHFGMQCNNDYYTKLLISACIMPIAVKTGIKEDFNYSHPLQVLDLFSNFKLSAKDLETMMMTKLGAIKDFTLANLAIDNFDDTKLGFYRNSINQCLEHGSALNFEL